MALTADQLIDHLRRDAGVTDVGPDTALFSSGLLDSVAMMGIIGFIEDHARIDVRPGDVTLDNFDSVERIIAYVADNA